MPLNQTKPNQTNQSLYQVKDMRQDRLFSEVKLVRIQSFFFVLCWRTQAILLFRRCEEDIKCDYAFPKGISTKWYAKSLVHNLTSECQFNFLSFIAGIISESYLIFSLYFFFFKKNSLHFYTLSHPIKTCRAGGETAIVKRNGFVWPEFKSWMKLFALHIALVKCMGPTILPPNMG